ncbi:hypothetical protein [Pelagibacterium lacus]|uniref:Uncharacterized protein n=1 Tax=Pelagibacterium lacus TaxID=2282655 RepID=A0A369W3F3_9HYPH|nr:hypothetical protein [Pelagibacterium lacus]RDE08405.1 hypothetical protein DVH29_11795 [Pelagibacterium lacus]
MKIALPVLLAALLATPAPAQVSSAYTRYTLPDDCTRIAASDGEGDWADFVCPGFGGYPFVIRYGDGRESITYGFATASGMSTFAAFNYANETVEWRIIENGETVRPFAAIQRWRLANSEGEWAHQMLVVSRVGQPSDGGACPIAFVAPTDGANDRARDYADRLADDFHCGTDMPVIEDLISPFVGPPN